MKPTEDFLRAGLTAEVASCPCDTNGDGDCGRIACPYCGVAPRLTIQGDDDSEYHGHFPWRGLLCAASVAFCIWLVLWLLLASVPQEQRMLHPRPNPVEGHAR